MWKRILRESLVRFSWLIVPQGFQELPLGAGHVDLRGDRDREGLLDLVELALRQSRRKSWCRGAP